MAQHPRTETERRFARARSRDDESAVPLAGEEGRADRGAPPVREPGEPGEPRPLSAEATRLLRDELRRATGRPGAELPADTAARARAERRPPALAVLGGSRVLLGVTFLAAVVIGGIVALATGAWWALLLAVGLHALTTMLVAAGIIGLTTEVEHVDPDTAARLEAEGIGDPDRLLGELVGEIAGTRTAGGAPEVLSAGHNERSVGADADPARAAVEQSTAMTPQSRPGPSAGEGSVVEALPWWVVAGVMVLSVAFAPFLPEGWALPLIVIPLGLAWIALDRWMAKPERATSSRAPGDTRGAVTRLAPVVAFVVAGVIWFMIVAGWLTSWF